MIPQRQEGRLKKNTTADYKPPSVLTERLIDLIQAIQTELKRK